MARTLAIQLPDELERRLEKLALETGRSESSFAREAIAEHLADFEDYYLALARKDEARLSLDDMERRLGMAD